MKVINEVKLCGAPTAHPCWPCCPTLKKHKDSFTIDDDFNSSIKIDNKDIEKLINDINSLLSLSSDSLDN